MKRLFGLIGYPLSHSWSKQYFEKKFQEQNIFDASYELFPLEELGQINQLIENRISLKGLNVTIPHKASIISYLDEIEPKAEAIGAFNTIKILRSGTKFRLSGFNTDVDGFEASIKPLLKSHHRAAMILGSGGAAKAAAWVFQNMKIEFVTVSRQPSGMDQLAYHELSEDLFEHYTIIVNATPLGMFPHVETFPPIPYQHLSPHHVLFDMVYNPEETQFLRKGKAQGSMVKSGLEMLYRQAEKSWEIWEQP